MVYAALRTGTGMCMNVLCQNLLQGVVEKQQCLFIGDLRRDTASGQGVNLHAELELEQQRRMAMPR